MSDVLYREIGRSGIKVTAIGLGCWAIGGPMWVGDIPTGWGEVDDEESIRAIHKGLDLGINFLDTADTYGAGHSEKVVARALGSNRKDVVIATKFGNMFDEATRQSKGQNATPDYIRQACEASLQRLNTDYIDLYQFHINGYDSEQGAEVRDVLEELVKTGKIRAYAWSTDFLDSAKVFEQGPNCTAIQFQCSVIDENAPMIAFLEEKNLGGLNRGPLAMGILTGKYSAGTPLAADDVRGNKGPEWMKYFKDGKPSPEWLSKMEAIREILTSNGRTVAQGALAWLWGRSEKMLPIPGFRTVAQVEENAGAMRFGPLTADQVAEIATILERETA
jgi:aryl-alcohol dehydrogenase-like predicted oxidoreductase